MTLRERQHQSAEFIMGWNYGKAQQIELSARERDNQFADLEYPEAFTQGNIDGVDGDRFRLDLALWHHSWPKRRP